jgi:raffinose/stachyose/melibiose transport system substrate-binding protein
MKKYALLLFAVVMAFTLSACGGNNAPDNGKTAGNATDAPTEKTNESATEGDKIAGGEPVTLKIIHWINEGTNKYYEDFNKRFTERYPNVKVDYNFVPSDATYDQLQQTRVNANDVDILALKSGFAAVPQDWSPGAQDPVWKQWIDAGLIADLSGESFISNWDANDLANSVTYNGKIYGVNMGKVAFTGLFYNKTIFEKYGLAVPTTWDELLNVFKVLKDNKVVPLGIAGKDIWPFNLAVQGLSATIHDDQLAFIKGLWDGSTKFTDPVQLEILEKTQVLMENAIPGFMGVDYGSLPGLFASEQVAMTVDGSWNAAAIKGTNPDLKFGYFAIPGSNDAAKNKLAGKYDMSWVVLEKAKNKEAALKWLEMQSEPEEYAKFVAASGFQPNQKVTVEDPFLAELTTQLDGFKLAWDQLFINRENLGEYASGSSIHAEFLAPAGPLKSAKELAEKTQQNWDAAAPK